LARSGWGAIIERAKDDICADLCAPAQPAEHLMFEQHFVSRFVRNRRMAAESPRRPVQGCCARRASGAYPCAHPFASRRIASL
jgi:hypothetical protein